MLRTICVVNDRREERIRNVFSALGHHVVLISDLSGGNLDTADLILFHQYSADAADSPMIEEIRSRYQVPIVIVRHADSCVARAELLEKGIDEVVEAEDRAYLASRVARLLARIPLRTDVVVKEGCRLDRTARSFADVNMSEMGCNDLQVQLLDLLLASYPKAINRYDLAAELYGDDEDYDNKLRAHVSTLRSKLKKHGLAVSVKTIPQMGYLLTMDESDG